MIIHLNTLLSLVLFTIPVGNSPCFHNVNVKNNSLKNYKLNWSGADFVSYANCVSQHLAKIAVPSDILLCKGNSNGSVAVRSTEQSCCDDHVGVLGKYYDDIKSCLHAAAYYCVPSVKLGIQKHW